MMYLPHAQCIIAAFKTELSRTEKAKELIWVLLRKVGIRSIIKGQYAEVEARHRQTLQLKETLGSMNNLAESLRLQ